MVGVADDVEDDVDADADLTVFFGGASPDHPNPDHVVCVDVVVATVVVIVPFRTLDLRGFGLHPPQIPTHGTGPITGGVPYHIHVGVSVVMGGAQLHNHHASVLLHSLHDSLTDSKDAAVGVGDAWDSLDDVAVIVDGAPFHNPGGDVAVVGVPCRKHDALEGATVNVLEDASMDGLVDVHVDVVADAHEDIVQDDPKDGLDSVLSRIFVDVVEDVLEDDEVVHDALGVPSSHEDEVVNDHDALSNDLDVSLDDLIDP